MFQSKYFVGSTKCFCWILSELFMCVNKLNFTNQNIFFWFNQTFYFRIKHIFFVWNNKNLIKYLFECRVLRLPLFWKLWFKAYAIGILDIIERKIVQRTEGGKICTRGKGNEHSVSCLSMIRHTFLFYLSCSRAGIVWGTWMPNHPSGQFVPRRIHPHKPHRRACDL